MPRRVWNSQQVKILIFEEMEMFITQICLLHIVYLYQVTTMYPIKMYR
jgi:hypothetical protein